MTSIFIKSKIYDFLGFRIYKHNFSGLGPINEIFGSYIDDLDLSQDNSIFYWWTPQEITHKNHPADSLDTS